MDYNVIYDFIKYRGPKVNFDKDYGVCIGCGATFGRFVEKPYPQILGELLEIQVLNLGFSRPEFEKFSRPPYLKLINKAKFKTIQPSPSLISEAQKLPFIDGILLTISENCDNNNLNFSGSMIEKYYPTQKFHVEIALKLKEILHNKGF